MRALRYYFDKTKDLRHNKELCLCVPQEDFFSKYIYPWIKQTAMLSFQLSDQEALTLDIVKAHEIPAFAVSKALQRCIH